MAFTVSSKHKVNIVQGENYFSHDLSNCTFELQKTCKNEFMHGKENSKIRLQKIRLARQASLRIRHTCHV